jgi:hypothetical protein
VLLDVFAALEAPLLAAFGAAAFVDRLAAVPVVFVALAETDFVAAALRAGAFLVVVLVAAFAIGKTLLMSDRSSSRLKSPDRRFLKIHAGRSSQHLGAEYNPRPIARPGRTDKDLLG